MKKIIFLILFIGYNNLTYGQSPITEFEETISYGNCDYVMAQFYYISSSTADCDSVCWDFGDGMTNCNSNTNAASHNYSKPGIYTVTLSIWLDGIKTQIVKPDLIQVYKAPEALYNYTVKDSNLIAPLQVDFENQSVPGESDSITYSWFINYSSEPASNDTNFSYVFNNAGTYNVQLMVEDNNGCQAVYSDYMIVKDSVQINEFNYITSECVSDDSCIEGVNYKIENDTLKLFGQIRKNCCTNKTAVVVDKLDTIQILTFESGPECTCSCLFCFEINIPNFNRDSCIVIFENQIIDVYLNVNSILSQEINSGIRINPNPFYESINVEISNMTNDNYKIEIYNLQGQFIQSQNISNESTEINASNILNGIYILKVIRNNTILKTETLIKK